MSGSAFSVTPAGGYAEPAPMLGGDPPAVSLAIQLVSEKGTVSYDSSWHMGTLLTVTATGGTAPYEYAWEKTGGDAEITEVSAVGGVLTLTSIAPISSTVFSATWELTVTDADGATLTQEYTLEHDWSNIPVNGGGGGATLQCTFQMSSVPYETGGRIESATGVTVVGGSGSGYTYLWEPAAEVPPEIIVNSFSLEEDTLLLRSDNPADGATYDTFWTCTATSIDTDEVVVSSVIRVQHVWAGLS